MTDQPGCDSSGLPQRPRLRLLADDLTGAIDSTVEWTNHFGPIRIGLTAEVAAQDAPEMEVINCETRDISETDAVQSVAQNLN